MQICWKTNKKNIFILLNLRNNTAVCQKLQCQFFPPQETLLPPASHLATESYLTYFLADEHEDLKYRNLTLLTYTHLLHVECILSSVWFVYCFVQCMLTLELGVVLSSKQVICIKNTCTCRQKHFGPPHVHKNLVAGKRFWSF